MKIEGKELREANYLDSVTYVPTHAEGNAQHDDCERGVIISFNENAQAVKVLYCTSRTVQATEPTDLVWG